MPFVKINLAQNLTEQIKSDISLSVHESLMAHFNVPADDYFHVIHEVRLTVSPRANTYFSITAVGIH
ncbi:tautomerase family protein [Chitinophaga sp. GbtcB8]|uniref:tautomerase family protein n=1 Tax=Chitinophaga sp. GbtcB8 TaxID=2824753 RepID=UPI001C306B47